MTDWSEIAEGFRFPALEARVTAERRRVYHRCCDVPEGRFGDLADVSIFGQDTALAARAAGLPLDGRIHLRCLLRQRAPVALGERLRLEGRVLPYGPSPRGRLLNAVFALRRSGGSVPLEIEMQYLLPGPASGERPPREAEAAADYAPLAALALTPGKVTGYSEEVGNLIHFDAEFAKRAGFRAPLAQGQMQVTAALGALAAEGLPEAFTLDCRFLRPLHWDERAAIEATADRGRLRFVATDGRIAGTAAFATQ